MPPDMGYTIFTSLDASFLHDCTEESRWLENSYKGPHWRWIQQQWKRCQAWFAGQAVAQSRVNGSVQCISIDSIRSMTCHDNGLIIMRIQLNRFGTHSREYSDADVHRTLEMIPCEARKGPSIGLTFAA